MISFIRMYQQKVCSKLNNKINFITKIIIKKKLFCFNLLQTLFNSILINAVTYLTRMLYQLKF